MGVWGLAPNKLEACAKGKGSEHASDPGRRHSQKLVPYIKRQTPEKEVCLTELGSALDQKWVVAHAKKGRLVGHQPLEKGR